MQVSIGIGGLYSTLNKNINGLPDKNLKVIKSGTFENGIDFGEDFNEKIDEAMNTTISSADYIFILDIGGSR